MKAAELGGGEDKKNFLPLKGVKKAAAARSTLRNSQRSSVGQIIFIYKYILRSTKYVLENFPSEALIFLQDIYLYI